MKWNQARKSFNMSMYLNGTGMTCVGLYDGYAAFFLCKLGAHRLVSLRTRLKQDEVVAVNHFQSRAPQLALYGR